MLSNQLRYWSRENSNMPDFDAFDMFFPKVRCEIKASPANYKITLVLQDALPVASPDQLSKLF